ncbi:MAG: DUF547 domain-containing protein [Planctomycetota bacterium]
MHTRVNRRALPLIAVPLLLLATSACSAPRASLEEKHPLTVAVKKGIAEGAAAFDHSAFDALLKKHVTPDGSVDYEGLRARHKDLGRYLERIGAADLSTLPRDELLAFLINAYNAWTLDLILDHYPLKSIRELDTPWKKPRCRVGGETVSLDFIEHSLLRVEELFDEPRVHFAVNCASLGCPPLRAGAFTARGISRQLDEAVRAALRNPRQLVVKGDRVGVTAILSWFGSDFTRKHGTLASFLIPHAPPEAAAILRKRGDDAIFFLDYGWELNGKGKA